MREQEAGNGFRRRASAKHSGPETWSRFVLKNPSYAPQYSQLYFCRLQALRSAAIAAARRKWGREHDEMRYADRVLAAGDSPDMDIVVAGILFHDLKAKPSILGEYGKTTLDLIPAPPARTLNSYVGDGEDERAIIEDETGRFALDMTNNSSHLVKELRGLVTGVIIAVRGRENGNTGSFVLKGIATAGPAPQPPLPDLSADSYVCIVSGLRLGDPRKPTVATELFLEYLRANLGDESDQCFSSKIVHLIVAGNCVCPMLKSSRSSSTSAALLKPHMPVDGAQRLEVAAPIVLADRFLTAAASALPVSVMPGENDPVNYLLPQQPIHRCLLPSSSRQRNLHRVTNPYECTFDDRLFLGTSGQNVNDFVLYDPDAAIAVARATEDEPLGSSERHYESQPPSNQSGVREKHAVGDRVNRSSKDADGEEQTRQDSAINSMDADTGRITLGILQTLLDNRHVAPTAPDTLGSYPFYDSDPFVLEKTPHVFFAGNQPRFATKVWKAETGTEKDVEHQTELRNVRLVSIPRFDKSGIAVLLNLRTLECSTMHFSNEMDD